VALGVGCDLVEGLGFRWVGFVGMGLGIKCSSERDAFGLESHGVGLIKISGGEDYIPVE